MHKEMLCDNCGQSALAKYGADCECGGNYTVSRYKPAGFVSRHAPTVEQMLMANDCGYKLEHLGDTDAFTGEIPGLDKYDTYCVVHPMLSARLGSGDVYASNKSEQPKHVLIFENGMRPVEGGAPTFYPKSLWLITPSMHPDVVGCHSQKISV